MPLAPNQEAARNSVNMKVSAALRRASEARSTAWRTDPVGDARVARSRSGGIDPDSTTEQDGAVPVLRIVKRQMTLNAYAAAATELGVDGQLPPGRIMHGATRVGDTMYIVQAWECTDDARRYDDEIVRPALDVVNAPMDAEIAVFELDHLITP